MSSWAYLNEKTQLKKNFVRLTDYFSYLYSFKVRVETPEEYRVGCWVEVNR